MALLTTRDVAERLAVSERHVQELAQRGELPAVRVGRLWRFRLSAVEAYEQRNTSAPKAEPRRIGYGGAVAEIGASWDAPRNPVYPEAWGMAAEDAASPAAGSGRTARTRKASSVHS